MFIDTIFQFLHISGPMQWYHSSIQAQIRQDPVIRLLPSLLTLPLFVARNIPLNSTTLLDRGPYVAVQGPTGSGRSLALLQCAMNCAGGGYTEPFLHVCLTRVDDPDITPRAILSMVLQQSNLSISLDEQHKTASRSCLLLLDEWEELPDARRSAWRNFLLAMRWVWPAAHIVVALPETEEPWTGFHTLTMETPDERRIRQWVEHLLPHHNTVPIIEILLSDKHINHLNKRLIEIVLLTLTYPEKGLPSTRSHLYDNAFHLFGQFIAACKERETASITQTVPRDIAQEVGAQNTLTHNKQHANTEVPTEADVCSSTLCPSAERAPLSRKAGYWASVVRRYEAAHAIATQESPLVLSHQEENERIEIALLLVSMLDNPTPLYTELWRDGQPNAIDVLILGRCLLERPDSLVAWGVPILEALATHQTSQAHCQLLQQCSTLLPTLLKEVDTTRHYEQLQAMLQEIAPALKPDAFVTLMDTPDLHAMLRWIAVDMLIQRGYGADVLTLSSPPDMLAQAARCYILAMGDTESRRALAVPRAAGWIVALRHSLVGAQRRQDVAQALLDDYNIPAILRATSLLLLSQADDENTLTILHHMCCDHEAVVRSAAYTALRDRDPQQALWVLDSIVLGADVAIHIRQEAIEQLDWYDEKEACILLARCAISSLLSIAERIQALTVLANKGANGIVILRQLLGIPTLPPIIRATLTRMLALGAPQQVLPDLCRIVVSYDTTLVRQAAAYALVHIARTTDLPTHAPGAYRTVIKTLLAAINDKTCSFDLKITCIEALGASGEVAVLPVLQALLNDSAMVQVRLRWLRHIRQLATLPVEQWSRLDIETELRTTLLTAMTNGETWAEQPGSFDELVTQTAFRLQLAAAKALAVIGSTANDDVRQKVRAILLNALQRTQTHQRMQQLLHCLARVSTSNAALLEELLTTDGINSSVRWLAIEEFGGDVSQVPLFIQCIRDDSLDPFNKARLAYALGQYAAEPRAVSLLCHLATDKTSHIHIRTQAVAAIGLLHEPSTVPTLMALITDTSASPTLRQEAARALPPVLDNATRQTLHDILHAHDHPPELITGVLDTLGKARDTTASEVMQHYVQSPHPMIALAALQAIAAIGDASLAPILVRVAQHTRTNYHVRFQAVRTLLHLCGEDYLPFLRSFFDSDVLPLQLQAFDELVTAWPDYYQPLTVVTDTQAPIALRLRALEIDSAEPTCRHVLFEMLHNQNENLHLRATIATRLADHDNKATIRALTSCVYNTESEPFLRRRCIDALDHIAQSSQRVAEDARISLGQLANDTHLPDESRNWAACALMRSCLNTGV